MLLVSMLLEKQSVQAGVEAQSWERGVEKDVEKTTPDKMSSLKSLGTQPVFKVKVDYILSYHYELEVVQYKQTWS